MGLTRSCANSAHHRSSSRPALINACGQKGAVRGPVPTGPPALPCFSIGDISVWAKSVLSRLRSRELGDKVRAEGVGIWQRGSVNRDRFTSG